MAKAKQESIGLVGRCFHIFGEDSEIEKQGQVIGDLGTGYFLVRYFDWLTGEPSTLEVFDISDMTSDCETRSPFGFQFYEDVEHMKFWQETHGKLKQAAKLEVVKPVK